MSGPLVNLRPLFDKRDGNRGQSEILCPRQSEVILKFRNVCSIGESIGVVLGLEDTKDPRCCITDEFVHVMVRGEIEWGLGATSFKACFDWLHGTFFTVVAEEITVRATYLVITRPWAPCPDNLCLNPLRVSAGVGYGCIGKGARFTQLAQVETPGESVILEIPPFATHLTVQPTCGQIAEVKLFDCGKPYAPCFTFNSTVGDEDLQFGIGQQIPIANGMRFVEVFNRNPADPLTAFVIFGLSL